MKYVLLAALLVAACDDTIRDSKNGFQITVPNGWRPGVTGEDLLARGNLGTHEHLRVYRSRTKARPANAAQITLEVLEEFFREAPGYQKISSRTLDVDGRPAAELVWSTVEDGRHWLNGTREILLPTEALVVSARTDREATLRGILESFRLTTEHRTPPN